MANQEQDVSNYSQSRPRLRFGIRDLIAVITIVGLVLALLFARTEVQALKAKLSQLRPEPHIRFQLQSPVSTAYGSLFTIRVSDLFYPLDYKFKSLPRMTWKLISVDDGTTVAQSEGTIDPESKIYQVSMGPDDRLPAGFYVVELAVLDGDREVANRWSAIRISGK